MVAWWLFFAEVGGDLPLGFSIPLLDPRDENGAILSRLLREPAFGSLERSFEIKIELIADSAVCVPVLHPGNGDHAIGVEGVGAGWCDSPTGIVRLNPLNALDDGDVFGGVVVAFGADLRPEDLTVGLGAYRIFHHSTPMALTTGLSWDGMGSGFRCVNV